MVVTLPVVFLKTRLPSSMSHVASLSERKCRRTPPASKSTSWWSTEPSTRANRKDLFTTRFCVSDNFTPISSEQAIPGSRNKEVTFQKNRYAASDFWTHLSTGVCSGLQD